MTSEPDLELRTTGLAQAMVPSSAIRHDVLVASPFPIASMSNIVSASSVVVQHVIVHLDIIHTVVGSLVQSLTWSLLYHSD
jgi:hypothetical protein